MVYLFEFKRYCQPLQVPLRTAHGVWAEREGLIIRLEDESGQVGYGEIAPIPWFGTETVAEAEEICRKFGDQIDDALCAAVPLSFGCVRFALAAARAEKIADASVAKLRLPVAALLPAGRAALTILSAKLEAGFLAFKWKVGVGQADDELGLLDDLLARLPAHVKLRLDANGSWTRRQAQQWLERCAVRPIEFIEQPVAPTEVDTLLGLARDYPVTLALDESVVRLNEARRWQGLGWPGVFVIKPALVGPLSELAEWIITSKADVVISSAIESALARHSILRLVLTQSLTQRALGFGLGEMFGQRAWDGAILGPLADGTLFTANPGEALWNELS